MVWLGGMGSGFGASLALVPMARDPVDHVRGAPAEAILLATAETAAAELILFDRRRRFFGPRVVCGFAMILFFHVARLSTLVCFYRTTMCGGSQNRFELLLLY